MNTQDVSPTMNSQTPSSSSNNEVVTPPRSYSPLAYPDAPRRRRQTSVANDDEGEVAACLTSVFPVPPRILIPTLDTHRNRGILAGDFIKPDPSLSKTERHTHILHELQNWLVNSMRIQTHAREVEYNCLSNLADEVTLGLWPAARLCLIAARCNFDRIHDSQEKYHSAATWAYWVCYNYLTDGVQSANDQEELALGFVTTDRFADGTTIEDLWNWSPTHSLRCAPPLPDSDAAEDERLTPDSHTAVSDEDEDEEYIDIEDSVCFHRVRVEAPAWMWLAALLTVTFYLWLVAYLVGAASRR